MLKLDEDVSPRLKSWKVPESRFTTTEKVTLRRLLSHTAGLTVHGFPGYDVAGPVPTLVQVLDGARPTNTAPIRVDTTPGAIWRYSGGGYTVAQQLMIDVTGRPGGLELAEARGGRRPGRLAAHDFDLRRPHGVERAREAAAFGGKDEARAHPRPDALQRRVIARQQ